MLDIDDAAMLEHDTVGDLHAFQHAVVVDRGEGADVGIAHAGAGPNDQGTAQDGVVDLGAVLHHHQPGELRARVHGPPDLWLHPFEDQAVGLEHVFHLAGVDPAAVEEVWLHVVAVVDQPLDGVRDLQFAARGGLYAVHGREDVVVKHVDADDRQVADALPGLLHQTDHAV